MDAAIYITLGVGGASILLMIIFGITIALLRRQVAGLENAVTELCHKDFESNTRIDDLERKPRAEYTAAEREHIRVVMAAGHLRGEAVPAKGGPDSGHLVCGNRYAYACPADYYPPLVLSVCNGVGGEMAHVGIIAGFLRIRSEVCVFNSPLFKMAHYLLFQFKSAVVTCYG